jgi:hypothetical protein
VGIGLVGVFRHSLDTDENTTHFRMEIFIVVEAKHIRQSIYVKGARFGQWADQRYF